MNITELDSYNLADAVKFNDSLNPSIWQGQHMRPEVREKLLAIAKDFQQFLGVAGLNLKDITVSGSNAGYTYTPHSDIDLHLVVDLPEADESEVYRELFDAKKYQYNDTHNITIGGYEVELYVENANEAPVSQGVYSVLNDDWISIPKRRKATINDNAVRSRYDLLRHHIQNAVHSKDLEKLNRLADKIKKLRRAGLDAHGELGPENLAYKMLRAQGYLDRMWKAKAKAQDATFSINERRKKAKKRTTYGYGGWYYPGYNFDSGAVGDSGGDGGGGGESMREASTPDGVSPSTRMFLSEKDHDSLLREFISFVKKHIGITKLPKIIIHRNENWSTNNNSFGRYEPETHILHISLANRHPMDVLRTLAHELVHCYQNEKHGLPDDAGDTGSTWENQANANAGIIMRRWAALHPEHFNQHQRENVQEASGYIPTEAEKNDPRYSMALSPDVRPGATGKNANKMQLKTDAQGRPALLMKTRNLVKEDTANDLNQPRGPETPPTMPSGTIKVDVSDMYDWYKLGQHISNMQGLGKHDFGAGPPSSILSFGSEELEHKYIDALKRTGLSTTDIDPQEHKPLKGQKVDKTYNVDEELANLAQEFDLLEDEFISEIRMGSKNLRQEAAKMNAVAGMEFEMISPGNYFPDEDEDLIADYDEDIPVHSWEDIRNFFEDDGYNTERTVTRAINNLQEEFWDYMNEKADEEWGDNQFDLVRDYVKENVSQDEIREALGLDEDHQITSTDLSSYTEYCIDKQNQYFLEARDDWDESWRQDVNERSWLRATYPMMSDVQEANDLTWPYYTSPDRDESSLENLANDFEKTIGRPVSYSTSYHGGRREKNTYVIEPDSSLKPDNRNETGLEFVSPPLPLADMLSDLDKVARWAGRNGCYTNESCGLHMNVSIPGMNANKLDYVKLALLLGDDYVLSQFGRSANNFAKSALANVKQRVKDDPGVVKYVLDKMQDDLESLASRAIHSGETGKYTSINVKDDYVEFRSPGGDWLGEYAADPEKITNTLLRFVVALDAAMDPEKYRQEYQKKLYKLFDATSPGNDFIKYFADYVAGKVPKAALKSFIKQAQLERSVKKVPPSTAKYWWRVSRPGSPANIEVVASSKTEALAIAVKPGNYPDWAGAENLEAVPLRPYENQAVQTPAVAPQSGQPIPGSTQDLQIRRALTPRGPGPWEIYNTETGQSAYELENTSRYAAQEEAVNWARTRSHYSRWEGNFAVRTVNDSSQQAGREFTGTWIIKVDGEEVHRMSGIGNVQADANRKAHEWILDQIRRGLLSPAEGADVEVVPLMEGELDEGWRDTLGNLAIAGAIGTAGAGGIMGKQAVGNYFTAKPTPAAQSSQQTTPTPKVDTNKASIPPSVKPVEKKQLQVKPLTTNPLESLLLTTAKDNGIVGDELAAFMAQCAHESHDFKSLIEYGGSLDFRKYDPKYAPKKAKILGNRYHGDGARYKGRGYIQITGRYNYATVGKALGIDLVKQPELAARPDVAAEIAVWFWKHRVKPNVQNFNDVTQVTKPINPNLNGLKDRADNFQAYKSAGLAPSGAGV